MKGEEDGRETASIITTLQILTLQFCDEKRRIVVGLWRQFNNVDGGSALEKL